MFLSDGQKFDIGTIVDLRPTAMYMNDEHNGYEVFYSFFYSAHLS